MHSVSVCVVSVLGLALISHAQMRDSGHNSDRTSLVSPRPATDARSAAHPQSRTAPISRGPATYGKLPLSFEANQGQTDGSVKFLARGDGYSMYLTSSEVLLSLHRSQVGLKQQAGEHSPLQRRPNPEADRNNIEWATVRMRLIGSNPGAKASGADKLPGKVNYLIGKDPQKWRTDVPTYAKVRLSEVYPGVDLVYYGNEEGCLEHDFVVAPHADPGRIEFDLRDQDRTPTLSGGELNLSTRAGEVKFSPPVAYQLVEGDRRPVEAAYEDAGSGRIRFRLGAYDKQQPLVIDPVLIYTSVFGGSEDELIQGVGIDAERDIYVAGYTDNDPSFPLVNPYQSKLGLDFVSKLNPAGTALLYSTYFGGGDSVVNTLSVDAEGRAYIGGRSVGGDIPIVNAAQPTFGGRDDGFITVLSPAGNTVEYSTYIGGPGQESVTATAVDAAGNLYITGVTQGPQGPFPATHDFSGGSCTPQNDEIDQCTWIGKYNRAGALQYLDLYTQGGGGSGIAADADGAAYISAGFESTPGQVPVTTPGAYSTACYSSPYVSSCPLAAKLSPAGDSLIYSTVAPVNGPIQVDRYGDVYIAGSSYEGQPVSSTAFQKTYGGANTDGYIFVLNPTGSGLVWATYLGGNDNDVIESLELDQYGHVYVSGLTSSSNFPQKASIQPFVPPVSPATNGPSAQFFVATLSESLSSIEYYSTYFGSAAFSEGSPVLRTFLVVDPALNVYLVGQDLGNVLPTKGAYTAGTAPGYVNSKISISKLTIMDDVAMALSATPAPVAHESHLTYTIAVTSKGPDFGVNLQMNDKLPAGTTFVSYNAGGGTCTAPHIGGTGTLRCQLAQLNAGATWKVKLTVKVTAKTGTTLSDGATATSNMQDFVPANNSAKITTKVD